MTNEFVEVSVERLEEMTHACLETLGLDEEERSIVAEVLLYAELRGNSQGLIKIVERTILPAADKQPMQLIQRAPAIAHMQANGNIGMVVFDAATRTAIDLCADGGLAIVTTSGCSSSSGALGYYANKIAEQGYLAVCMAGSPKVMALHGSGTPAMGTNPLAFAAPADGETLVIDMASAAISWFDLLLHARENKKLPEKSAVDSDGRVTQSADQALEGAILPFGDAKGSALALMIETLTGPLCAAAILGDQHDSRGHCIIALDPLRVGPEPATQADDSFKCRLTTMLERMRGNNVRLPGEQSSSLVTGYRSSNKISVRGWLLRELQAICSDDNV